MRIPGLKFVSIIPASVLPDNLALDTMHGQTLQLPSTVIPSRLAIVGDGTVENTTSQPNNGSNEEFHASFYLEGKLGNKVFLCFIFGFVDGSSYLVGTKESPASFSQTDRHGAAGSDNKVEVTVDYTAPMTMLPVTVQNYTPAVVDPTQQNTQWWREITEAEIDDIINALS